MTGSRFQLPPRLDDVLLYPYAAPFQRAGWVEHRRESVSRYRERVIYRRQNPFVSHLYLGGGAGIWLLILQFVGLPVWSWFPATLPILGYPIAEVVVAWLAFVIGTGLLGSIWARTQTRAEEQFDRTAMYPPAEYWAEADASEVSG